VFPSATASCVLDRMALGLAYLTIAYARGAVLSSQCHRLDFID
jgi:hypothetical protein